MWKETVVAYFEVPLRHFPEGIVKKSQKSLNVCRPLGLNPEHSEYRGGLLITRP